MTTKTYRLYVYLPPNQQLVCLHYDSLAQAIEQYGLSRIEQAIAAPAGPWIATQHYDYDSQQGCYVLNYGVRRNWGYLRDDQGQRVALSYGPYKKKRRKEVVWQKTQVQEGRRLREESNSELPIRAKRRVQPMYYEDAYMPRKTQKSWKKYRTTQWRE